MRCENCDITFSEPFNFCPNCGGCVTKAVAVEATAKTTQAEPATDAATPSRKVRAGGWIIVFCIFITIVFPISSCSNFSEITRSPITYGIDKESSVYQALGVNAFSFLIIGVYSFFSGLAIWTGSPNGRRIAYVFLIIYPISAIASNLTAIEIMKGTESGAIGIELLKGIVGALIFSAIWLAYFKWSKRVKATYS